MSINLQDVPYPHPVSYYSFTLEGQDVRMAYMDVAPSGTPNGKSVVLLHGMNFFGEAWTETIEILRKEGYRVIVPDQIGYGRSSKPILHYSISTHASNTNRLLEHLGIKTTDIVTHSMGGMVASRFASSYPERVGSLAMINQIGLTDARSQRPWRETSEVYKANLARDYAEILRGMRAYYVKWKPEYMKYVRIHYGWIKSGDWPRMAMVRALQQQAIYADPVVDDWARIKARTLVIGGEKDGADYPGQAKHVAETIPNGQLYIIPNVGHNPQFEAPDLLYPPLLRFLKGENVGTRKSGTGTGGQ
jgi:pimeloyl-ACP methyl ester carboxylesterase